MKKNKIQKKTLTKRRRGLFAFLFAIAESIARAIKRGPIGYLFADLYTKCNDMWKNGWIYNLLRRKKQNMRKRATFAHVYEESRLSKRISSISDSIIHSHIRIWGTSLFFFALSVIGTVVIKYYYFDFLDFEVLNISAIMVFLSLMLMISRKELGEALLGGRLTRFIITNVLNLNPTRFERNETSIRGSYLSAIFFSIFLGFVTYFTHPMLVVNLAIICFLFALTMSFPELGLIFVMLVLPFANVFDNPSIAILVLLSFTACGFFIKLLRGKRIFRLELIDVLVLAFSVLMLFGGIFSCGGTSSLLSAELYFAFIVVYFLIVNMYIGKPSIYRAFKILIATATIVSIIGIIRGGVINESWVDVSMFGDLPGRVSVLLDNPNTLGAYLIIVFPLTLGQMIVSTKKRSKMMYFVSSLLILACTIMTGSRGAWLGMIVATVVFLIVYNFKNIWLVLATFLTLPLWGTLLPGYIINRFQSIFSAVASMLGNSSVAVSVDTSTQFRLDVWKGALEMAKDNFFTGIGVGQPAFEIVYGNYAVPGTEGVVHAHSLPLQILVEIGIVGLVIFGLIIFMLSQKCFVEIKQGTKKSKSRTMLIAGLSSIVGALVMGLFDDIWYNYRVFIMFWIVVAITVSLSRNNVRERESTRNISNMTTADLEINR